MKKCKQCGDCCKNLILPLTQYANDDVKKWLEYHGVEVIDKNPFTYIKIPLKCSKLVNNKCSIYDTRPETCREYFCENL